MAQAANVRLVRCPKCENLLPELPDFSLYQCGGCGAVLKAKQEGVLEDGLTDIPLAEIPEETNIVEASEVKMKGSDNFEAHTLEEAHKGVAYNNSSTSRAEGKEAQSDSNLIRQGKQRIRNFESLDNNKYTPFSRDLNRNPPINRGPAYIHLPDEPLRPRPVMDHWGLASGPGYGTSRDFSPQMRFGDYPYFDEGQSSYETDSYYNRGERNSMYRGPIEDLENGRAELIRRLDELKDQISRSCEISDKSSVQRSTDPYGRPRSSYNYPENPNKQPLVHDDVGSQYFVEPREYVPYKTDRYSSRPVDSYHEKRYPHEFMHYSSAYNKPEILHNGPTFGPYSQYHGQSHDLFMLNRRENFLHQPACSCMHCYDKSWPGPPKGPDHLGPQHNPRFRNEPSKSNNPDHRSNLRARGPQNKSMSVNSNDMDSDNDGLNYYYHRPRKFLAGNNKNWRASRPVAGGAPYIACGNCFEVLKMPRRRVLSVESKQKLKCGACSSIIVFELGENGFVVSTSVDQEMTKKMDDGSSGTLEENKHYNEYDDFFQVRIFSTDDKKSKNSLVSEKQLDQLSSGSSLSEDGRMEVKSLPPDNDLPPDDKNITVNRFDRRNKSQRPEQEKISLERAASQQKSVKDDGVATEMDVSLNEFSNSCVSQDSVEISKEANKPKANKGGESFFAGLIKKGLKDFKKPNHGLEAGGLQVYVNGHFIPDSVVKRAEKLAGPIQPGEYWYDKRAGFWGVMGHPCLGIIMPNIEEFDYPMPDNCAAGNTGVFVNGRELHQKDLDLLVSRGLPITRNRSYSIEITGRVVDEQTGEELDGLGKLAPTVERAKHGFGMKVPRFLAQSKN
ncbi:hypothetical protein STAS_02487 [Striga asiatica]|uniref:Uncharacterized protein n=1 Tax=Striga asiatica TaxID=4170 RepID=A0A5A7P226_STRAF|nr:hypothetical protein STAS_02487 [Striga asiatica]